jgi:hypothetical protein
VQKAAIKIGQTSTFPGVCAKTGVPADRTIRQEFGELPGWTLLLIFWGFIPFLIATGFARRKVTVELPLSARTRRNIAVVDLVSVIGVVVGFGLLLVMWVIGEIGLALGAAGLVVAVLIGGSVARRLVWVSGRLEGDVLWLYGVHPRFAEEAGRLAPPELGVRVATDRWGAVILMVGLVLAAALLILMFLPRT